MPQSRLKLVWFVVKTRLSRSLLALDIIMLAYGLASGAYIYANHIVLPAAEVRSERTMAVIYSAIVLFLASVQGGVTVLKSDRDYLFTLPVSRGSLAASLYVGQMMLSGLLAVAWLGWYLPFIEVPLGYAAVNMVLFVLLLTSLSASIAELPAKRRVLIASLMAAWAISTIFKNPVTPSGVFYADYVGGTATLAALTVGLTYYVAVRLGSAPMLYGGAPVTASEGRGVSTSTISFSGVKGAAAILRMRLNTITLSGRVGGFGAGGARYVTGRVSVSKFMAYMLAAAASLMAMSLVLLYVGLLPSGLSGRGSGVLYGILFVPIIALEGFFIGSSPSQVASERPWLAFLSMDPGTYMWVTGLSWALVVAMAGVPFSLVYTALWLMGVKEAIDVVPQLLVVNPAFSLLAFAVTAMAGVSPQIRSEGYMPGQARARSLAITVTIIVPIAMLSLAIGSLTLSLYLSLASAVMASPFLAVRRLWAPLSRRLVENGYV